MLSACTKKELHKSFYVYMWVCVCVTFPQRKRNCHLLFWLKKKQRNIIVISFNILCGMGVFVPLRQRALPKCQLIVLKSNSMFTSFTKHVNYTYSYFTVTQETFSEGFLPSLTQKSCLKLKKCSFLATISYKMVV